VRSAIRLKLERQTFVSVIPITETLRNFKI